MKLTEVQSSHVEAVGYIPEDGVLLVRYKGGSLHARTGVTVDRYIALLESASKGSFLVAMQEQSVCIIRGGSHVAAGNAGNVDTGPTAKPTNVESSGGRIPGSPALTLNEILKAKAGQPDSGCDFAVVAAK